MLYQLMKLEKINTIPGFCTENIFSPRFVSWFNTFSYKTLMHLVQAIHFRRVYFIFIVVAAPPLTSIPTCQCPPISQWDT